ncbi:WG repeat-containing protein [Croceimicrobium hydrocarbonivorans]|uniref:WG repeat-containing protein n=1 Tax=Croceimicrobium hydrocarbonivorans TaxID=2761580 RepID=A0A7H0VIM6_9FLAO|nr:WG repeat-containing protein [Croceimicrobium hydrocarbonivorans]QNR25574.1 WG repeat-containing protein [Croceimicrobium hydrocarbonivorans]
MRTVLLFLLSLQLSAQGIKAINGDSSCYDQHHRWSNSKDSVLVDRQQNSVLSLRDLTMIPSYPGWQLQSIYALFQDPKTHLYGLKRKSDGKVIISARYEQLKHDPSLPFVFGLRKEKWYLYKQDGTRISSKGYQKLQFLRRNFNYRMLAQDEDGIEVYNPNGQLLWSKKDLQFRLCIEDQFHVIGEQGQGVLNWNGKEILKPKYDSIFPLKNVDYQLFAWKALLNSPAIANAEKAWPAGRYWGLADTSSKILLPFLFDRIEYARGLLQTWDKDGATQVYDSYGNLVIGEGLKRVEPGACRYCSIIVTHQGSGLFNGCSRSWDEDPLHDSISIIAPFYYQMINKGKKGILTNYGDTTLKPAYESIFYRAHRFFYREDGKWALADENGKELLPPIYDSLDVLVFDGINKDSCLLFSQEGKRFEIRDRQGNIASVEQGWQGFSPLHSSAVLLHRGLEKVLAEYHHLQLITHPNIKIDYARPLDGWYMAYGNDGKEGLWMLSYYNPISPENFRPAIFDSIVFLIGDPNLQLLVQQNDKWGVYSIRGDSLIIPCEQDVFLKRAVNGWLYFRKDGVWNCYFYTSPSLKGLNPMGEKKVEEMWRAQKEDGSN